MQFLIQPSFKMFKINFDEFVTCCVIANRMKGEILEPETSVVTVGLECVDCGLNSVMNFQKS